MRKLTLPATLAYVVSAAACGGDDQPTADAGPTAVDANVCTYYCYQRQNYDDGGPIGPGEVDCSACAQGPEHTCPRDCESIPIV